ncbi:hypothetical protein KKF38_03115 [Patescibacteria group bacterium]|nr:hypothetical protein [Patescibacteria group bacterium]
MQKNKNHFEIGEKRFLWRQIIQQPDISNEIFQRTSLRITSRRKKEAENISDKIEAKKEELLRNQAEHEELLVELSKQNCDTQKIATLVLREIKNEFLKNIVNENNKFDNGFCDENVTRSMIENLWKDLQKNLDVIQCKNLAKEVLQMLPAMQQGDENIPEIHFNNSLMSVTLQKITQVFSEESDNARWQKAEDDWRQQKKGLEKIFASKKSAEEGEQNVDGRGLIKNNAQGFKNKKIGGRNAVESFLENLDDLSPENRWKIAEKILKSIDPRSISGISPNNLKELAEYIASIDRSFARKINLENLLGAHKTKTVDKPKKSWWSLIADFFKNKLVWLLLLFLVVVVGFLIFENFSKVENL